MAQWSEVRALDSGSNGPGSSPDGALRCGLKQVASLTLLSLLG